MPIRVHRLLSALPPPRGPWPRWVLGMAVFLACGIVAAAFAAWGRAWWEVFITRAPELAAIPPAESRSPFAPLFPSPRQAPFPTPAKQSPLAAMPEQVPLPVPTDEVPSDPFELAAEYVPEQLVEKVAPAVVGIQDADEVRKGSGFVVAPGLVVTNYHVAINLRLTGRFMPRVLFQNRSHATILGYVAADSSRDIIILRVAGEQSPPPLPIASGLPQPGDAVYAFAGGALRSIYCEPGKVTATGPISGFPTGLWIATTAQVVRGFSGGPMVNARGEVIGMNSRATRVRSYAVPAADILRLLAAADGPCRPLANLQLALPAQ